MPGVQRAPARVRLWEKAGRPSSDPALSDASSTDVSTDGSGGFAAGRGERRTRKAPFPATRLPVARRRPKTPAAPVQTGRGPRTPRIRSRPTRPGRRMALDIIGDSGSPVTSTFFGSVEIEERNTYTVPSNGDLWPGPGRTTTICIRPTATAPASAVSTAISRWAA